MNVCHILVVFIFILTTLQDGEACFYDGDTIHTHTGTEGGDITFVCGFEPRLGVIFCRDDCKVEDILIEATGVRTQRGRYRMEYDETLQGASAANMYVTISNLTKADSGGYSCVFAGQRYKFNTFQLRVEDAPQASRPTVSPPPVSSPEPETPAAAKGLPPETNTGVQQVQLLLLLVTIVSAAALMMVCRKRTRRHVFTSAEDPQAGLEDADITSANREHEGVGGKILEI